MEILGKLGIDWKILIAQLVNFGILIFVLTKFLYKPIINVLEKRKNSIEENLKNTLLVEEKLKEAGDKGDQVLKDARKKSEEIVRSAESAAGKLKSDLLEETKKEQKRLIEGGLKELASEREKILREVKKEIGAVVSGAISASVGDVVDKSAQEKLQRQVLEKIS